jgi:hypothetical protein
MSRLLIGIHICAMIAEAVTASVASWRGTKILIEKAMCW